MSHGRPQPGLVSSLRHRRQAAIQKLVQCALPRANIFRVHHRARPHVQRSPGGHCVREHGGDALVRPGSHEPRVRARHEQQRGDRGRRGPRRPQPRRDQHRHPRQGRHPEDGDGEGQRRGDAHSGAAAARPEGGHRHTPGASGGWDLLRPVRGAGACAYRRGLVPQGVGGHFLRWRPAHDRRTGRERALDHRSHAVGQAHGRS
mmetsp:Transcript_24960/g.62263  ORF Transcript_24960/g.62263 Transcript_24960/m.62263 type:complete len:203 (+) Transcript_24960:728-1336(+)